MTETEIIDQAKSNEQYERERIKYKRTILKKRTHRKHLYYVPTGVGERFITAFNNNFITAFFAANGVGKTLLGVNVLAQLIWPNKNIFFDLPIFKKWPYPKAIRVVSDPATISQVIIPEMQDNFPDGRYTINKHGKNYEYEWKSDTGWTIWLMTYDQAVTEFESATLGLVWFDEPPPQRIYKANVARLRKGGKMLITATPLTGSGWLYDSILARVEKGVRTVIEADVETACIEHGERGFLRHEDIQLMISEYNEEDMQARVHGKFQHLIGLVFKSFSRLIHVIRPFEVGFKEYSVIEALDPHPQNPDAVSWVAVDQYGQKFVVDELYLKCQGGSSELAQRIKKKAEQYRIVKRIADPALFIDNQHSEINEKSTAQRLKSFGLTYQQASKTRSLSNRRIDDALDYRQVGNEMVVTPEIYFFDTCHRHIWEMEHWRWDEWQSDKTKDRKESPGKGVDKDDHFIENLGRILSLEPMFQPYYEERRARGQMGTGEIAERDLDPYY